MKGFSRYPLLLGAVALQAACSVGPQYHAPVAPIHVVSPQAQAFAATPVQPTSAWWTFFDDPQLERLIATALAHNHAIEQAHASLLLARAHVDEQALERLPTVTSSASYQRSLAQQARQGSRRPAACPNRGGRGWTCSGSLTCSAASITWSAPPNPVRRPPRPTWNRCS